MSNLERYKQKRERPITARPSWTVTILSAGCYICGSVFIAVMVTANSLLGAGLAALAASLFIICGRLAGGEHSE